MTIQWKYYNHAVIPTTAPHRPVQEQPLRDGTVWKVGGFPLLARWTSNWDCGFETNWWYCIRDGAFALELMSSSTRKRIRQAMRKNRVEHRVLSEALAEEMYAVYLEATAHYERFNQIRTRESYFQEIQSLKGSREVFLSYDMEGALTAYITCRPEEDWVEIESARFGDKARKIGSSDALYYNLLDYYLNERKLLYVSSGARTINHITETQEYKERVFGYRKAYCYLHIKYRLPLFVAIQILYPFREKLKRWDSKTAVHQLNALLNMEELVRTQPPLPAERKE